MNELAIIKNLFNRQTLYIPIIAKATGSIKLAILWSQIHYWTDKTKDQEKWVYKSRENLWEELGMTRRETELCRELGSKTGILESEVRGTPPTVHFKINEEKTIEVIKEYLKKFPENFVKEKTQKELKSYNSMEWLRKIPPEDMKELMEKYQVESATVLFNADNVITYCRSKGKGYKDYKAALMNFIKSDLEKHPNKKRRITQERPKQETIDPRETRTPEEQLKINKNLDSIRESLNNKFKIKS